MTTDLALAKESARRAAAFISSWFSPGGEIRTQRFLDTRAQTVDILTPQSVVPAAQAAQQAGMQIGMTQPLPEEQGPSTLEQLSGLQPDAVNSLSSLHDALRREGITPAEFQQIVQRARAGDEEAQLIVDRISGSLTTPIPLPAQMPDRALPGVERPSQQGSFGGLARNLIEGVQGVPVSAKNLLIGGSQELTAGTRNIDIAPGADFRTRFGAGEGTRVPFAPPTEGNVVGIGPDVGLPEGQAIVSTTVNGQPRQIIVDEASIRGQEIGLPQAFESEAEFFEPVTRPLGRAATGLAIDTALSAIPGSPGAQAVRDLPGVEGARAQAVDVGGSVAKFTVVPSNLVPIPIVDAAFAKLLGLGGSALAKVFARQSNQLNATQARIVLNKAQKLFREGRGGQKLRDFVDELRSNLTRAEGAERAAGDPVPAPPEVARRETQAANVELSQPQTDADALRIMALDEPRIANPLRRLEELARNPQPNNSKWVDDTNAAMDDLEANLRNQQKLPAGEEADLVDEVIDSIVDRDGTLLKANLAQPAQTVDAPAAAVGVETEPGVGVKLTDQVAPPPRPVRQATENEAITGLERNVVRVKISQIESRPDLFQTRDVDVAGAATGKARVNELSRNFDVAKFTPPKVLNNPEIPGRYIVRDGHHRLAAAAKALGPDAEVPVILIDGDIRDPNFLASMREAGAASNFSRAELNIREQARTVQTLKDAGIEAGEIAERLRMSPAHVQDLEDLLALPATVLDRIVLEKTLAPIASEIGRAMRVQGLNQPNAGALFARFSQPDDRGRLITRPALRQLLDKFASKLPNVALPGFEATALDGAPTGILKLIDDAGRARADLIRAKRSVQAAIKGTEQLGELSGKATSRLTNAGKREVKRLERELKDLEKELTASLNEAQTTGGKVPPREVPPSVGDSLTSGSAGAPSPTSRAETLSLRSQEEVAASQVSVQARAPSPTTRANPPPSVRTGPSITVPSGIPAKSPSRLSLAQTARLTDEPLTAQVDAQVKSLAERFCA